MPSLKLKFSLAFLVVILFPLLGSSQVTEDFESGTATGWTTSGTSSTGTFVVANPSQQTSSGVVTQPADDHTPASGVNAYFTGTNVSAGNIDVDGGTAITTSPVYNIPTASQLSIWYFFGQRDNGDDAGDFFLLEYSLNNGSSYTTLTSIGDVTTNANWTEATVAIPGGSNVVIRVSVSDGSGPGDIIEGGIDDLTIIPLAPTINIDDVAFDEDAGTATFTATHTIQAAGGAFTVDYATADVSAVAPADYTASSGTLNFDGTLGDTELIVIPIADDFIFEGDETFTIQFTATSDGSVDISDTATGTIQDDESDPNATRPYEERDARNLMGNFKMKGNTNLQCVSGCPSPANTNNPGANMGYVDVDTDGTTVNSSSSTLTLPAGAIVEWAGLYWGGVYNSSFGGITNPAGTLNIDQVKLMEPGVGSYTTINAEVRNIEGVNTPGWNSFMAHADITSIVQSGGNGNYFVADIALATGSAFTGPFGGWTMVVVYDDPTEKTRRINVWDGFDIFRGGTDNFTVTGLLTPGSGAFETHAGYFGMDGEANQTGDFVSINGTALANGLNPNNNTLNGTISEFGVDVGGRNPNLSYSWAIDCDIFDGTGLVPNSATTANVTLGSSFEGIWGGVFVISNEIAFPAVASKDFDSATVYVGDESTVSITVNNPAAGVPLTNFSITDTFPTGMTIASTPNASSSCGGTITAPIGATSFTASGITLPAGGSCTFTFDVVASTDGSFENIVLPADITNDQSIPLQGQASGILTVLPLPDNDGDGIADRFDLDDDNDGITDTDELNTITSNSQQDCTGETTLDFSEVATLESGTTLLQGAVYRIPNVTTGTDALVTIEQTVNASPTNVDNNTSDASAFRPQTAFNLTNIGDRGYIEYKIQFVNSGGSTPVVISKFFLNFNDIDGNANYAEQAWSNNPTGYIISNPTELTMTTEGSWVIGTAGTTEYGGAGNTNPQVNFGINYNSKSEVFIRVGGEARVAGASAGGRQHNIEFSCLTNYNNPENYSIDTDSDGIANHLDLDADNDGIYDAVEAGHGQVHTAGIITGPYGANGLGDGVETAAESGTIIYTVTDTDGTESANFIDTDSDGDGCSDANEAYANANADAGDNEYYGTGNPPTVDADGRVTIAAYPVPADVGSNATLDYVEAETSPVITLQPPNTIICPGCNTTISVITGSADTFQWQFFNGISWVDLTDSGIYNGTSTATITLTNVTTAENGNQYRVVLTNVSYICNTTISATAVLTVQVNSVITNRRITYRVKKN